MGRRPQPQIRQQLLDACVEHVLAHGLPDRLAPLVQATGTSARMLLYHFGTRDALLRAVLQRAREQQVAVFGDLLRVRPGERYTRTLERAWRSISGADGDPYVRVFGRSPEAPVHRHWPGFERQATTDWLEPLALGLSTLGRGELATLVLAVVRGLLLDLSATGDRARADDAFGCLLDLIDRTSETAGEEGPRPPGPPADFPGLAAGTSCGD